MATIFRVRLDQDDWDQATRGWRCSALRIPGAEVKRIFHGGKIVDTSEYQVDTPTAEIRWPHDAPDEILVEITLSEGLSTTTTTAVIAAVATVLAALISSFATYETSGSGSKQRLTEVATLIPMMVHNLDEKRYADADTIADQILDQDKINLNACNTKGTIAFYRGQYPQAITFFKRALNISKNNAIVQRNLADAFVENGDYQDAIRAYLDLNDTGNVEWKLQLARAYLYADNFQKCLDYVKEIPTSLFGGHPRMIQAAALAGVMKNSPGTEREKILAEIRRNLAEGRKADPLYWDKIFAGGKDEHVGYSKVTEEVGFLYKSIQSKDP